MSTAYVPADNDGVATRRTLLAAVVIHQPPPINPSLAGFPPTEPQRSPRLADRRETL